MLKSFNVFVDLNDYMV